MVTTNPHAIADLRFMSDSTSRTVIPASELRWTVYKALSGAAGIAQYYAMDDCIWLEFHGHTAYLYTAKLSGLDNIVKMKALAESGQGLSTYLNQNQTLKKSYKAKYKFKDGVYIRFT